MGFFVVVVLSHKSRPHALFESHCSGVELLSLQFVRINKISVHIWLLLAFWLAASTAAAGALDAASSSGKVEPKYLKLAELATCSCAFFWLSGETR